jgi:putative ABC transport system permease protein
MEVRPILSALLRNRAGATLVAIQIAITLAIVVNAIYVTEQRVSKIGRPSGIDDQNIFSFNAEGFEKGFDFSAMVRDDLALMRQMPGVVDAAPMRQIPLSGGGNSSQFFSLPDKKGKESPANIYDSDEHAVPALGVKLSAGSTFDPGTIQFPKEQGQTLPPTAIVTQAFAKELFPDDRNSLGRTFYDNLSQPIKIVGIIEHMHGAWVGWDKFDHIVVFPRVGPGDGLRYIVRATPGDIDRVMTQVEIALRKRDPNRVLANFKKMSDFKKRSYASDSLVAVTLSVVTGLVLVFSALGIFGLATFNVNTRTRQIGTRRAIGARRRDIVRYFMTENWFVTTLGVVVGCAMALGLGFWLSKHMGLPRLDLYYLVGGVAGIWVIGQLAAWQPSLKAAKVSPAMATRTV